MPAAFHPGHGGQPRPRSWSQQRLAEHGQVVERVPHFPSTIGSRQPHPGDVLEEGADRRDSDHSGEQRREGRAARSAGRSAASSNRITKAVMNAKVAAGTARCRQPRRDQGGARSRAARRTRMRPRGTARPGHAPEAPAPSARHRAPTDRPGEIVAPDAGTTASRWLRSSKRGMSRHGPRPRRAASEPLPVMKSAPGMPAAAAGAGPAHDGRRVQVRRRRCSSFPARSPSEPVDLRRPQPAASRTSAQCPSAGLPAQHLVAA